MDADRGLIKGVCFLGSPPVKAEQDGSVFIGNLAEVIVVWRTLGQPQECLIPFKARGDIAYANDRPNAFHSWLHVMLSRVIGGKRDRASRDHAGSIADIRGDHHCASP